MINQDVLKKDIESKAAKIIQRMWRYKKFLRETKFNDLDYLENIAKQIDEVGSPLTAYPKVPKPQKIDYYKLDDFINQFESDEIQNTAKKVIENHLQYYSFENLEDRLKKSVHDLNRFLITRNIDSESVSVLIESGHSSEWVASLAVKYLRSVPKNYIEFNNRYRLRDVLPRTFSKLKNNAEHTIVIFDDWSISGRQLHEMTMDIANCKKRYNDKLKLNIVIVIPLMTKFAYENNLSIFNYDRTSNINLKYITTSFIPSVEDVKNSLNDSERGDFNQILGLPRNSNNSLKRNVIAYSDWKVPDEVSMPFSISTGQIPWGLTPYNGMHFSQVPAGANGNKFLPDVKPPYHRNRF